MNDSVSHASLPIDSKFWDYLFLTSQKNWELFVYEQDSLDLQFEMIEALKVSTCTNYSASLLNWDK